MRCSAAVLAASCETADTKSRAAAQLAAPSCTAGGRGLRFPTPRYAERLAATIAATAAVQLRRYRLMAPGRLSKIAAD